MRTPPRKGWAPQAGSQQLFLEAPWDELLYHGTRGPGKSLALLMGFAQHVGRGFGEHWRGVIFREQSVELPDLVAKSKMWFRDLFPDARFIGGNEQRKWVFAGGEELAFRHIKNIDGYDDFHGHEIPYIAFDELCNWPSGEAYLAMRSCVRSTGPKHMPRQMRAACNPWGVGRGWVKERFIDPAPDGTPIYETFENPFTGETITRSRVALRGTIWENKILLEQDPAYLANLLADPDPNRKKAWLYGSWDAVSGGIFEGRWDERHNVVLPFKIPKGWMIDRAFDDGHTSPYAVGWFAESDGSPATMANGTTRHFPKGTVFMIAEYYGWNGKPNEGIKHLIREKAEVILEVEAGLKRTLLDGHAIYPGPADPAIYNVQEGKSIGDQMAANGVSWKRADKGSGSRVAGWQQLGSMMQEARSSPMERPAFLVFATCRNFLRTVPTMVRDRKDPDDADTTQEDHMGDMVRYRVMRPEPTGVGVMKLPRVH